MQIARLTRGSLLVILSLTASFFFLGCNRSGGGGTNLAPIALGGGDLHTLVDALVTLQGSGTDAEGKPLDYFWTQSAGPTVSLSNSNSATPVFRPTQVGVYVFTLTVNDGAQNSSPVTVTVFVHDINGGDRFSVALKPDGTLWSWGYNNFGQLGNNTQVDRLVPGRVCDSGQSDCDANPFTGIVAISVGRNHVLALKSDGSVWAWGNNGNGQLGDGTQTFRPTPVRVCDSGAADCNAQPLTGVVAIAAGYDHSVALKADGSVLAWGRNWDGEVGTGSSTSQVLKPVPVCAPGATAPCTIANGNVLTGIEMITAGGGGHSLAMNTNGEIYGWGYNKSGQIGIGDPSEDRVYVPTRVCNAGGSAPCSQFLSNIVAFDVWSGHSLALDADGQLWGWGGNDDGELSVATSIGCLSAFTCSPSPSAVCATVDNPCTTPLNGVAHFVAGRRYSMALLQDGTIRSWGENLEGQLGDGTMGSPIGQQAKVCAPGETAPCANFLSDISAISAGNFHSFALSRGGLLYVWGQGDKGALGNGDIVDSLVPIQLVGY